MPERRISGQNRNRRPSGKNRCVEGAILAETTSEEDARNGQVERGKQRGLPIKSMIKEIRRGFRRGTVSGLPEERTSLIENGPRRIIKESAMDSGSGGE